ncbi:MAG: 50S ribosomal protein L30e [Candidatus Bathyarchaeia archaeon]
MSYMNKAILMALKAGKARFGCKQALEMLKSGKAKLVILASNCPEKVRAEVNMLAKLSNTPVFQYPSSSTDLGVACSRTHTVAAMALAEIGESETLMRLVKGVDIK